MMYDIFSNELPEKFILYFPTDEHAPFHYCCKIKIHNLSIPSIIHNFDLEELLQQTNQTTLYFSEICIVIQSRHEFYKFYFDFFQWFLESERIEFTMAHAMIENFLKTGQVLKNYSLKDHRSKIISFVENFFRYEASDVVVIDHPSYSLFRWENLPDDRHEIQIAIYCLSHLVDVISPSDFLILWSAVLQEFSIIVYGIDIEKLSSIVLALHYLIFPLHWVSTSVSILPESQYDLLCAPTAFIYGITKITPRLKFQQEAIFLDLEVKKIRFSKRPIPIPGKVQFIFETFWNNLSVTKEGTLQAMFTYICDYIRNFLECIPSSISINYTSESTTTLFMKEFYLLKYCEESREFVDHFISTQMMMFYIEQESRKKLDQYKGTNTKI